MGESLPPVWYEEMKTSKNEYFRNSCWSLPAFRQVRIALLMWSPVAQAISSIGVALLTPMVKWKSCIATLPDPPPPVQTAPIESDWTPMSGKIPPIRGGVKTDRQIIREFLAGWTGEFSIQQLVDAAQRHPDSPEAKFDKNFWV